MAKYLPHGTTVAIGSDTIGGIIAVSIPDRQKGAAETTDTNSNYDKTYIPGLREGGTVTVTARHNMDDIGQQAVETNYDANGSAALETFVITLPSGAHTGPYTYTFTGFISEPWRGTLDLVADKPAEVTCQIKVAGAVSAT